MWLPEVEAGDAPADRGVGQARGGRGERILVVDDEEGIRTVTERILTSRGYDVTACANAATALDLFRASPESFDVVFSDYTMPGMTGLEMAAEMISLRPGLPVVLGTGYAEGIDSAAAAKRGIGALVMKPYGQQKLAVALDSVLHPSGSRDSTE